MSNVVIMVWMKNLDAGFGDLLRGTIYLHQLSQKMNFNLIVDIQLHPVSQFLIAQPHAHLDYVIQNQSKIINAVNVDDPQFIVDKFRAYQLGSNPNPILITTNYSADRASPTDECKRYMRSLLFPTDEFKTQLNDMCIAFKIPKYYSIIHFRLGDDELIHHAANLEQYNNLFKMVDYNVKRIPNLYIMTDSAKFKQYLRRTLHPTLTDRIISTVPIHLSHPDANIETVKDTLFDFMLLTNAIFIQTHSVYGWISGFVQWVSHIFNVPLINLRPRPQPIRMNVVILNPSHPSINLMKPINPIKPKPMKIMKLMKPMHLIRLNSNRNSRIDLNFNKMF